VQIHPITMRCFPRRCVVRVSYRNQFHSFHLGIDPDVVRAHVSRTDDGRFDHSSSFLCDDDSRNDVTPRVITTKLFSGVTIGITPPTSIVESALVLPSHIGYRRFSSHLALVCLPQAVPRSNKRIRPILRDCPQQARDPERLWSLPSRTPPSQMPR